MKSWRRWFSLATGVCTIFLLSAIPMLAAEAAEQDPAESPAGVAFRWLNFFLVFGGIGLSDRQAWRGVFPRQREGHRREHPRSHRRQGGGGPRVERSRTPKFRGSTRKWRNCAKRRGGTASPKRNGCALSGKAEIEKIKQAARGELAASERAAQQQLREMAASMAVERAGALVASRMNQGVRAKLFHSFLGELGRSTN